MDQPQWITFTERLFVEYPSLFERLQRAPSPEATLEHWRKKLSRYRLDELNAVLDAWDRSNARPWDSYALESAPAIIASVCDKNREKESRKAESERIREAGRNPRRKATGFQFSILQGSSKEAYEKLRPLHAKAKTGEISWKDYNAIKDATLGGLS